MNLLEHDLLFMRQALQISHKALPACHPNPPVGCVIVEKQTMIAQGYTRAPGEFHAEADALSKIDPHLDQELSLYVTLEPCSFQGRTPSCAKTIAQDKRIKKIYIGITDPDPRNNGKGIKILKEAGKIVITPFLKEEVSYYLRPFLYKVLT